MFDAPWHWVVLAIVVIALFGYKRLPDASRAVGRSLRIFKSELKGMNDDDNKRDNVAPGTAATTPELPPAQPDVTHPRSVTTPPTASEPQSERPTS